MADLKVAAPVIKGSTYGIYYEAKTQKDYENIQMTKDASGVITISEANNVDFYLPKYEASKIVLEKSKGSRIYDGLETDGNEYYDDITLGGERNVYRTSYSKNGADFIKMEGKANMAEVSGAGNTVRFDRGAVLPMVLLKNTGNLVVANHDVSKDQLCLLITPNDSKFNDKMKAMKDLLDGTLQRKTPLSRPVYFQKSKKDQTLADLGKTYVPAELTGKTDMIATGYKEPQSSIWAKEGVSYVYTPEGTKILDDYLLTKTVK